MEARAGAPSEEIKHLQRCINDLVSLLTLPATWSGIEPPQIVRSLLDALMRLLSLDLVYARLNDPIVGIPIEKLRVAQGQSSASDSAGVCKMIRNSFGGGPHTLPALLSMSIKDQDIGLVPLQLGLQGEIGLIVAGSQRAGSRARRRSWF